MFLHRVPTLAFCNLETKETPHTEKITFQVDRGAYLREIQLSKMSTMEQGQEKEDSKRRFLGPHHRASSELSYMLCEVHLLKTLPRGVFVPILQMGH